MVKSMLLLILPIMLMWMHMIIVNGLSSIESDADYQTTQNNHSTDFHLYIGNNRNEDDFLRSLIVTYLMM